MTLIVYCDEYTKTNQILKHMLKNVKRPLKAVVCLKWLIYEGRLTMQKRNYSPKNTERLL